MSDTPQDRWSDHIRTCLPAASYFLVFLVLTWLSYSSYYPGLRTGSQVFTPAFHRATWEVLTALFGGYGSMLVFNAMLLWMGLILTVTSIVRQPVLATMCILLLGLSPYYFPNLAYHHKDIPFGASLLLSCGLLLKARDTGKLSLVYLSIGALLFATCMRHNGFPAVFPLCFSIVHVLKHTFHTIKQKTAVAGIALFVIIFVCAGLTTSYASKRYDQQYPLQILLLYDVVGTSIHGNEVFVPDFYTSKNPQAQDVDHLKKLYSEKTVSRLLYDRGRDKPLGILYTASDLHDLERAWVSAIARQPLAYLKHRTRFFKNFLYPPGRTLHRSYIKYVDDLYASKRIGRIAHQYLAGYYFYPDTVFGKPLALFIAFIGIMCWLLQRRFRDDPIMIGMTLSGLLYLLSYWFVGASIRAKYSWWGFISVPVILLYVLRQYVTPVMRLFRPGGRASM